jgi:hypothetical protein
MIRRVPIWTLMPLSMFPRRNASINIRVPTSLTRSVVPMQLWIRLHLIQPITPGAAPAARTGPPASPQDLSCAILASLFPTGCRSEFRIPKLPPRPPPSAAAGKPEDLPRQSSSEDSSSEDSDSDSYDSDSGSSSSDPGDSVSHAGDLPLRPAPVPNSLLNYPGLETILYPGITKAFPRAVQGIKPLPTTDAIWRNMRGLNTGQDDYKIR